MTEEVKPSEDSQQVEQHAETSKETSNQQEKDKDYNFAQVRKQLKERDDYILNLKKEMDELRNEFKSSKAPVEEEPELDEDDFITKKHLKKYAEQIAVEKYQKLQEQERQQNWKSRIKSKYSDFDQVVNAENIQRLEQEMPEIAKMIIESGNGDNYKMGSNAYKAIQSLLRENTEAKEIEKNKEALEKNKKEPLAAAAVDRRPIAQATRLTDKDYQELWAEMQHFASKA